MDLHEPSSGEAANADPGVAVVADGPGDPKPAWQTEAHAKFEAQRVVVQEQLAEAGRLEEESRQLKAELGEDDEDHALPSPGTPPDCIDLTNDTPEPAGATAGAARNGGGICGSPASQPTVTRALSVRSARQAPADVSPELISDSPSSARQRSGMGVRQQDSPHQDGRVRRVAPHRLLLACLHIVH